MTVFGPIVPATVVTDLLLDKLREAIEDYLGEVERVTGRTEGSIMRPKTWGTPQGTFTERPERGLPAISIVSPGNDETPPRLNEEGLYDTTDRVEVRILVTANGFDATDRLAKHYAAAVAAIAVQQPLGAPVLSVDWRGTAYDDLQGDRDRSFVGVTVKLDVRTENVLQRFAGPETLTGARDPLPDLPTVQTVGVVGQRIP